MVLKQNALHPKPATIALRKLVRITPTSASGPKERTTRNLVGNTFGGRFRYMDYSVGVQTDFVKFVIKRSTGIDALTIGQTNAKDVVS